MKRKETEATQTTDRLVTSMRAGEHRTVGPHRACCLDCNEWCSPRIPCDGCDRPGGIKCADGEANINGVRMKLRAQPSVTFLYWAEQIEDGAA